MSVLVTLPGFHLKAGVCNYFQTLRPHFKTEALFFELGYSGVKKSSGNLFKLVALGSTIQRFRLILRENRDRISLVHLNPSLRFNAALRDGILLNLALRDGIRTVVFFHGWDERFAHSIGSLWKGLFLRAYGNAYAFIVLASDFRAALRQWGIERPIFLGKVPIAEDLMRSYSQENRIRNVSLGRPAQILFFARVEKEKGIMEAIQAFRLLSAKHPHHRLTVVGDGSYLPRAKSFVDSLGLERSVRFLGYVEGMEKEKALMESDICLLPSYSEGMPTTVIEAMAFGLPIVARPVGALRDFFVNGKHGFLCEGTNPADFAERVERILSNEGLWREISSHNCDYAKKNFTARRVAAELESIYSFVVNGSASRASM